ncbi:hypothetical protein [Methylobacterium radiodurans]|uniref:Uncharacterized protein n=1 Tax=Methylobacterium radiodurans TaxID=2202828 RepID=A0A2U8VWQ5_9HYPH|nr:hypothetical protein [Methylobacterium radiodurans]AWN37642.1 hypothetical protein DK427_19500 [Methylobacterium radiodurans]
MPGASSLRLPPRPLAGAVARRRRREARIERAVLGGALLLALTASGFAGYVITGGSRPYAVQAVLPAGVQTFAWKRGPDPAPIDLDPTTTGAIPERPSAPPAPEPAAAGSYTLRRVSTGPEGSVAVLEEAGGPVREVATGGELPGAGRVLAIRSTGAGWVVITTQTIIGPARL